MVSAFYAPLHRVHRRPSYSTSLAFPPSVVQVPERGSHAPVRESLTLARGSHMPKISAQPISVVTVFGFFYLTLIIVSF
jgi:hypothetical protein